MIASMRGHIEIMKYLHDQGADIYYQNLVRYFEIFIIF